MMRNYTYGGCEIIKFENTNIHLTVGNFCSIAKNVRAYLDNGIGHDTTFVSTFPFGNIHQDIFPNVNNLSKNSKGNITIGNDVWISENVTIMSGITIGDGAVIACNSHIVKNIEPYSLVGGNPAKFIKYRFNPKQIEKLLEIKWWNWSEEQINFFLPLICSNNVDDFINAASNSS